MPHRLDRRPSAGTAEAVQAAGLAGLQRLVQQAGHRCHPKTLQRILLWAKSAPTAHPQPESLRRIIDDLFSDWTAKKQQILGIERDIARLLTRTPYVRLLILPGINVVSAADVAGELGPITHYADANHITGRAGLVPTRYQSDRVDRPDGTLRVRQSPAANGAVANRRQPGRVQSLLSRQGRPVARAA